MEKRSLTTRPAAGFVELNVVRVFPDFSIILSRDNQGRILECDLLRLILLKCMEHPEWGCHPFEMRLSGGGAWLFAKGGKIGYLNRNTGDWDTSLDRVLCLSTEGAKFNSPAHRAWKDANEIISPDRAS